MIVPDLKKATKYFIRKVWFNVCPYLKYTIYLRYTKYLRYIIFKIYNITT